MLPRLNSCQVMSARLTTLFSDVWHGSVPFTVKDIDFICALLQPLDAWLIFSYTLQSNQVLLPPLLLFFFFVSSLLFISSGGLKPVWSSRSTRVGGNQTTTGSQNTHTDRERDTEMGFHLGWISLLARKLCNGCTNRLVLHIQIPTELCQCWKMVCLHSFAVC